MLARSRRSRSNTPRRWSSRRSAPSCSRSRSRSSSRPPSCWPNSSRSKRPPRRRRRQSKSSQTKTELLESRAQQAARRDQELAKATDDLREKLDSEIRYGPRLPAPLKELFDGNYTNETPVSIYGQMLFGYNKQNGQNGNFTTMQVSPYFLVQLNKRFLVEASIDLSNVDGVGIGNAQIDVLLNKWMTLNVGRFITPIGQFNLWYNHEWVNRLPDPPLMFNQVSPPTSTDGIQLSGATYLGASPVKFTYQLYFGNGFQVAPKPCNYSQSVDLGRHHGRSRRESARRLTAADFGLWIPRQGSTWASRATPTASTTPASATTSSSGDWTSATIGETGTS